MKRFKFVILLLIIGLASLESATDCTKLRAGQFICPDPDSSYDYIDKNTQSVIGCKEDRTATGKLF